MGVVRSSEYVDSLGVSRARTAAFTASPELIARSGAYVDSNGVLRHRSLNAASGTVRRHSAYVDAAGVRRWQTGASGIPLVTCGQYLMPRSLTVSIPQSISMPGYDLAHITDCGETILNYRRYAFASSIQGCGFGTFTCESLFTPCQWQVRYNCPGLPDSFATAVNAFIDEPNTELTLVLSGVTAHTQMSWAPGGNTITAPNQGFIARGPLIVDNQNRIQVSGLPVYMRFNNPLGQLWVTSGTVSGSTGSATNVAVESFPGICFNALRNVYNYNGHCGTATDPWAPGYC